MLIQTAIGYCWEALGVLWLFGFVRVKRTVQSQPIGPRLFHLLLSALGFVLLGSSYFSGGWLGDHLIPQQQWTAIAGFALTAIGSAFTAWARITLGANWSGHATLKSGHELITSGPYSLTRHPIYTGLVLASTGTAIAFGQARCFLGLVVIVLALLVKISQEERLMLQKFPDAYSAYRVRVRALVPGVF